jgi:hypothetical protein
MMIATDIKVGDRIRNRLRPGDPYAIVLFIDRDGELTVKYDGYEASDGVRCEDAAKHWEVVTQ